MLEECIYCGTGKGLREITTEQSDGAVVNFFAGKQAIYERYYICSSCIEKARPLGELITNSTKEKTEGKYKNPLASFIDWMLRRK